MLIWAHRGASADRAENTLPAFEEAVRQGADGVELDAMVCGSGEVVVCHDEDLQRLAGVDVRVARTSFSRLARFDIARHLGKGSGASIPTLESVLDLVPRSMTVNIELKCDDVEDRGLAHKVGELVTQRDEGARVVISSFNPLCLVRMARAFPELRRGYLLDPDHSHFLHAHLVSPLVSSWSIHPYFEACTDKRVRNWHAAGLRVCTWTVDDAGRAFALERLGVHACITNRPGALRAELANLRAGV